jgi:hypothetical protein
VAGGKIEGKVKFRGQIIVVRHEQPYAGGREVPYPACDEGALAERNYARPEARVARGILRSTPPYIEPSPQLPRRVNLRLATDYASTGFLLRVGIGSHSDGPPN